MFMYAEEEVAQAGSACGIVLLLYARAGFLSPRIHLVVSAIIKAVIKAVRVHSL